MQPTNEQNSDGWAFRTESESEESSMSPNDLPVSEAHYPEPITWTGSEYISQHKSGSWYFLLFAGITVVCAVIYLVGRDIISVVFVAVMGILFAVIASRKPRQLEYLIDDHGLRVGNRIYAFNDFKSFSLQRDGAIGYISLVPLKRLHTELSVYFAPEDEERIFQALAQYLPNEQHKETFADKFSRKIRF